MAQLLHRLLELQSYRNVLIVCVCVCGGRGGGLTYSTAQHSTIYPWLHSVRVRSSNKFHDSLQHNTAHSLAEVLRICNQVIGPPWTVKFLTRYTQTHTHTHTLTPHTDTHIHSHSHTHHAHIQTARWLPKWLRYRGRSKCDSEHNGKKWEHEERTETDIIWNCKYPQEHICKVNRQQR